MIVVIVGLNALPVKFYGETEFWYVQTTSLTALLPLNFSLRFAGLKVIMMTGLLMLSFILFWGGG